MVGLTWIWQMLSLIFLMEHLDNYNFSLPGLVSFLVIFPSFLDHELSFPCRYFGNFFTIFAFWKFYNYFIHYIHSFCHSILNSENKSQWQRLEHATLRSTRTDVKHICHIFVVEISMSTISSISCFLDLHFFYWGQKFSFSWSRVHHLIWFPPGLLHPVSFLWRQDYEEYAYHQQRLI